MEALEFKTTEEVEPAAGVVGQDAAVDALRFGLEIKAPGQNIFVRGLSGTGRLTLVRRQLEEARLTPATTKDQCYVHNFSQAERPRLITLGAGEGQAFRRRIDRLVDFIRDDLSGALSSEGIKARRGALAQTMKKQLEEVVEPFEKALQSAGLTLVSVEAGPVIQTAIFPLVNGKAIPPEEFDQLHARGVVDDKEYRAARDNYAKYEQQLSKVNDGAGEIRQKHDEAVADLLEKSARAVLDKIVRDIRSAFSQPAVHDFLSELVDDVVQHHLVHLDDDTDFTGLYRVNVILEHKRNGACPIIVENTPTTRNLIGTVDVDPGAEEGARPSHMGLRAGSLLRADGGYLILEDRDVLNEAEAWKVLMRALRTGRIEITPPEMAIPGWAPSLKPEPIEIDVKVVMLGDPDTYAMLDANDPHFPQLFKVLVDFDTMIPRDAAGLDDYAAVIARIARDEHLPVFGRDAVARLVEHGARMAARNGKLSARFGRVADIAREAAFMAGRDGRKQVTRDDVHEAVIRGRQRADLPSRQFGELVADGTIRLDTEGAVVGQINGLAVLQAGPLIYGFPTRITATIGPGTAGVINIEREAALSGAIHTKGFYILGGLMRFLLRTDHPLAFDASVAFEQSYGAIDGDSASGAEICCVLSALTEIPLRQDLALTGAIDQMGHMLAVGAVNEKIEGFFDACADIGSRGVHGVIIPKANAGDLMIREDVVEACAAGSFHVYTVETVQEALELLTGMPAGTRDARGRYPAKGTVLGNAVERAHEYWLKAAHPSGASRQVLEKKTPGK
jgi:lon-related putative ATP-dependent protease